jgi:hypothetical protein
MKPFTPPTLNADGFDCPNCDAFAEQRWYDLLAINGPDIQRRLPGWRMSWCNHCKNVTLWNSGQMIYPDASIASLPNADMPEAIKDDYEEARSIISKSARGAAALFRLCIQKLCVYLGQPGKNLNTDIAALVKGGLNPKIQRSLDIVRVIGNESVHPGTIDLRDDPNVAVQLANLVNLIVDATITQPKLVDQLYERLPQGNKDQISKRDGAAGSPPLTKNSPAVVGKT